MYPDFIIDEERCTRCGLCIRECGHHGGTSDAPPVALKNPDCTRCYHCYTICPSNAIRFAEERKIPSFSQSLLSEITSENLSNFLAYRRSIRDFENKPVERELVSQLVHEACFIPSGGNAHSYEFLALEKGSPVRMELQKELLHIYEKRSRLLNNAFLRNAAIPFVNKLARGFLRDRGYRLRIKHIVDKLHSGEDQFFRNAPVVLIFHSEAVIPTPKEDCILAGYNIAMHAQIQGLGSCFVTLAQNAINASTKCKKLLGLSERCQVNAVLILGYPAVHHQRSAPKKEKNLEWR